MITGGQPDLVSGSVCARRGATGHDDMRALSGEFQCGEETDSGVGTRNQDHLILHFRSFLLSRAYHRGRVGVWTARVHQMLDFANYFTFRRFLRWRSDWLAQ
jgi:hypothetical protein